MQNVSLQGMTRVRYCAIMIYVKYKKADVPSPGESSIILFGKIHLYVPSQLYSTSMTRIILSCVAESCKASQNSHLVVITTNDIRACFFVVSPP